MWKKVIFELDNGDYTRVITERKGWNWSGNDVREKAMVFIEMSSSFATLERTYMCACSFVRFALVNLIIFFMPDGGKNILQEIYVLHVYCIRLRINLHYCFSFFWLSWSLFNYRSRYFYLILKYIL